MASTIQLEIPTPEEAAARLAEETAANEMRERARLAAANRAAGHAQPKPGDRIFVATARGIPQRSRAGCHFKETARTTVHVVPDGQPTGAQSDGSFHVTAHGAEMILADSGLNVNAQNATEADASELRIQLAAKDAELEKLKAENARLREARMAAKDDPNGGPARLRAARGAKSDPGFGGGE